MVEQVLVPVGDHGATPVPTTTAHHVHSGSKEGVGIADHCPDVEVVLPVLDGHMEGVPSPVQVVDDGVHRPVAIAVGNVAPIALGQQVEVHARIVGPRLGMWTHPDTPRGASRFLARFSGLFVDLALCGHQPTRAWLTSARRSHRLDA